MSMSRKKCCVPGCLESGESHKTLHLFPNPAKERQRFNQWVFSIGGDIIGLDNEDIYRHRSVCHAHFEEKFCCRNYRLSNIAVPTLNLPGPLSIPKFSLINERRPMSQIQNYSLTPAVTSAIGSTSDIASTSAIVSTSATARLVSSVLPSTITNKLTRDAGMKENIDPVPEKQLCTASTSFGSSFVPDMAHIDCHKGGTSTKTTKIVKKPIGVTPTERKLYQRILKMRIKLSKSKNLMKKQMANIKAAKNLISNQQFLGTMEKMSSAAKILMMMQLREIKKQCQGRRFSLQEKILALTLFKQAPKGYRFLRKIMVLPAPQTLSKFISQANITPGINKKVFRQLKHVAEKMKAEERLCLLLFDEMSLKANLSYNERKDKIIGFVTDGIDTKPEFADHAQVYMIRGLVKNYKQPVSYIFSAGATSGQQIAKHLKEIIKELQEAGLVVLGTVCDQGANNRLAIKLLLQETRSIYIRNGQEPKKNIILINSAEVIPLYDPPHLIKCIRNNLLTKNLQYTSNDMKTCVAKWEHLILLHKENPGYKGVRLLPKLTDMHVLPEKVAKNKMKVKFATQIFSRTVATNMGYLADKGIIPKECKETADLLLFFDNLFDSQNGSFNKNRFAKPLLGPVTPNSTHNKLWAEAKLKLKTMKFVNSWGKTESVPTLINWAWTLDGTQILLKKLVKEYKVTSVWMRHLNQDPLENFFGAIRSHGCRNTNPTPEKFEGAYTTLLINNLSSVHAPTGTNCEADLCKNLHALIITDDCKATVTSTNDIGIISDIKIDDIKTKNDPRIMAPLEYISGYFIKTSKAKVFKNCQRCKTNVIATEQTQYISYREYAGRQWLCSPTYSVILCISAIQDVSNTVIKECIEKNNIKELIKTYVLIFIEFDFLDCNEHKDGLISYLLNGTTRFFIYNYCKDLNRILIGKRECYDHEDPLQMKAKKHFKKCIKRPNNKRN